MLGIWLKERFSWEDVRPERGRLEIRQDVGGWGAGERESGGAGDKKRCISFPRSPAPSLPYSPLPSLLFLKNYGVFRLPIVS
jgi:hypothetical protein